MRETQAIIDRTRRVAAQVQHLELSVDPALAQLQPGQSVLARPLEGAGWDPYLRDHWLPVALDGQQLTVEVDTGRADYAPGRLVSLLSPVGRAIPLRSGLRHLLLIAEDTHPTPLTWLMRRVIVDGGAVTLVLGGVATEYPLELLPPEVEILHADTDWKWPDQVEMLDWAHQVIALAPPPAQAQRYARLFDQISQLRHQKTPDGYVYGLYTGRLGCGLGACQSCQVSGRGGDLLACVDGPALDLTRVKFG